MEMQPLLKQYKSTTKLPWIIKPAFRPHKPLHRRAITLAWMLATMILSCCAFLLFILLSNFYNNSYSNLNITISISLLIIYFVSYAFNIFGRYYLAASLIIAAIILSFWGSVFWGNTILSNTFLSTLYIFMPVFIAGLLLSVRASILVAVIQFTALYFFPIFFPFKTSIDWTNQLSFFLIASGISILTNLFNKKDVQQLEEQTKKLTNTTMKLRETSFRDPLTKLYNRRYLMETLERELHRSAHENSSLGILILDVDHFKKINDRFGHAAGDMVLTGLGQCLQECIRKSDIACRYGGEEFVLVLPGASLDAVSSRAEYLREEISNFQMEYKDQIVNGFTISIGIAVFPDHGTDKDRLLINADEALYRAKRAGRNRVISFQTG